MKIKDKKLVKVKTNQTIIEEFQSSELLHDDMEVDEINPNLQSTSSHQKRQHSTHIPTDIEEQIL
ncbi:34954_t:CDS:1, partial [Racocetra persica]